MRTAAGFNEELGPENHHGDPLDTRTVDFDYPDGGEPEPAAGPDYAALANAISRIFGGLVDGEMGQDFDRTVGRRVIALVWVVNPTLFAMDEDPSLAHIASRLGISRAALSAYAAKFSREFGLRNRSQAVHGWNAGSGKPTKPAGPERMVQELLL